MQYSLILPALAATVSASSIFEGSIYGGLVSRQSSSEETYIDSVCQPNTTDPVPPCQAIITIEEQCQPNGTSSLDYIAHQECMCGGGFFSNWNGCQQCQYVHGARSEAVVEAFESIISSASVSLCTGTPTASFAAIFSSIADSAPQVASGAATTVSDQYPSDAAVSLYYTASGPQGAGAITGSATAATATSSAAASGSSSAAVVTPSASSGTHTASGSSSAHSSSASSGSMTTSHSSSGSASAASTSATSTGGAAEMKALGGLAALVAGGFAFM